MKVLKEIALEKIENFPNCSIETLRNILNEEKVYLKSKTVKKYRKRFEAECVGQIVQGDVSEHSWIPDIYEKYCLILFIDDKSRYVLYAKFVKSDSLENHIIALKELILTYGYPIAIYYDNDSKYNYIKRNGMYFDLEKETEKPLIPRALNELGITLINSKPYQPQRKGKVERKFLTFQKQLPFYLKSKGAKNIDEANKVLEDYIIKHNQTINRTIGKTPEEVFKNSKDVFIDVKKNEIEEIKMHSQKEQQEKYERQMK